MFASNTQCFRYFSYLGIGLCFGGVPMNPPYFAEHRSISESKADGEQPNAGLADPWIRGGGNELPVQTQHIHRTQTNNATTKHYCVAHGVRMLNHPAKTN